MISIAKCHSLTRLHLHRPEYVVDGFRDLFHSPFLQSNLASLVIEYCSFEGSGLFWDELTAEDFASAFTSMHALTELALVQVCGVERLLPHLAYAPALQKLTLEHARGMELLLPHLAHVSNLHTLVVRLDNRPFNE